MKKVKVTKANCGASVKASVGGYATGGFMSVHKSTYGKKDDGFSKGGAVVKNKKSKKGY